MRQLKINRYLLLSKQNNKGEAPIYLRVLLEGRQVQFSTGIFIQKEFWDKKKKEVKSKHPDALALNLKIEKEKKRITDIHYDLERTGISSIEKLKDIYTGKGESQHTVLSLLDYHNTLVKNALGKTYAKSTHQGYQTLKAKITKYIKSIYKKQDLDLTSLNLAFLTKLEHFLSTEYKNSPNTIAKQMDRLKHVIHVGLQNDWIKDDPFKKYEKKTTPTNRQYLTQSEIESLANLDLATAPQLERTRDVFLFGCYTGLSYSDLKSLKSENIVPGIEGLKFIEIERTKTFEPCKIPLLPQAELILEKYAHHPICLNRGVLLPVASNTKMNDRLKKLAPKAGITKPISCHISRHSFATLSLENSVPMETVSKVLGHRSIKTTQIYGKVTHSKIAKDYAQFYARKDRKQLAVK